MTMLSIAKRQILPAAAEYSGRLAEIADEVGPAGSAQRKMLKKVCELIDSLYENIGALEKAAADATVIKDAIKRAKECHNKVIPEMTAVRKAADELERIVDAKLWPLPSYAEMLFLR